MISEEPGIAPLYRAYRDSAWALKHTSRASNPLWYKKASEQPVQWHFSVDGNALTSAVWKKSDRSWSDGPAVSLDQLQSPPDEFPGETARQILRGIRRREHRGLGILIHQHDSFQLAEIRNEFTGSGEDFLELDEFVRIAPEQALSSDQVDPELFSYSVLPYWGAAATGRNAVALQTPHRFRSFVEQIVLWGQKHNIPVKVAVTAAPLEVLARIDFPPKDPADESSRDGRIVVFRGESTSFVAILNNEDELCSARILANQGSERLPSNFPQVLHNCAASEDIQNPFIQLVERTEESSPISGKRLAELGIQRIETGRTRPIEFSNPTNSSEQASGEETRGNLTASELSGHWAERNLYSLDCLDENRFPSQRSLQILKLSRIARMLLVMTIPVTVGWCAIDALQTSRKNYWKVSREDVAMSTAKLEQLTREKKRIGYWENLTASRSEGWIPLTAILELLPEEKGILLTDFEFSFRSLPPGKRSKYLPLRQTWRLKGHATAAGMQHLVSISSKSNLSDSFDRMAEWSDSAVYGTAEGTRSLRVLLDQKQDKGRGASLIPPEKASQFRNGFEIEIERNFSEKDEIALVIKTPSSETSPGESMNQHDKAILLFGGLPTIVILGVLAIGFHSFRNGLEKEKRTRRAAFQTYQENRNPDRRPGEFPQEGAATGNDGLSGFASRQGLAPDLEHQPGRDPQSIRGRRDSKHGHRPSHRKQSNRRAHGEPVLQDQPHFRGTVPGHPNHDRRVGIPDAASQPGIAQPEANQRNGAERRFSAPRNRTQLHLLASPRNVMKSPLTHPTLRRGSLPVSPHPDRWDRIQSGKTAKPATNPLGP